ncbi:E3 ubiquitin-protein ligase RNF25 isoform X3 [Ambystoma mexicanum]|uniref:E3 ubiquitin-protein ligase RNF25 isoform X3 n=1 Tax=Ambystoma mexicanum TaxID=8296 RepID=UPI0037E91742
MAEEEEDELWSLLQELEVLESIYPQELLVSRGKSRSEPWEIRITLYPATAEDQESQYVRVTLQLSVPPEYPKKAPKICMQNPRGLSDDHLLSISQNLRHVAESGLGGPVLYELLVKAKEILTENNIPYGECVICQYGFQANEAFTKTACYHYFHSHCLARYAHHMEEEVQSKREEDELNRASPPKQDIGVHCPVCREPLTYDLTMLQAAPPPNHPLEVYSPNKRAIEHQRKLRKIYEKQQAKGGIIDPEAERNRYFISLQKPLVDENSNGDTDSGDLIDAAPTAEHSQDTATAPISSTQSSMPSGEASTSDPAHSHAQKDDHLTPASTTSCSPLPYGKSTDSTSKVFSTNSQHRGWPRGERSGYRGQPRRSRHSYNERQEVDLDQPGYFRGPPLPREFAPKSDRRGHAGKYGPRGSSRAHSRFERRGGSPQAERQAHDGTDYSYIPEKTVSHSMTEKENASRPPTEYRGRGTGRGQNSHWIHGDGKWERPRFRDPGFRPRVQQPKARREMPTDLQSQDSS